MPTYDEIKEAVDFMDSIPLTSEDRIRIEVEKAAKKSMEKYAYALKNLADR